MTTRYGADFLKVRVGVGRPTSPMGLVEYVLAEIPEADREQTEKLILRAADAVETALLGGEIHAMNCFNGRIDDSRDNPGAGDREVRDASV